MTLRSSGVWRIVATTFRIKVLPETSWELSAFLYTTPHKIKTYICSMVSINVLQSRCLPSHKTNLSDRGSTSTGPSDLLRTWLYFLFNVSFGEFRNFDRFQMSCEIWSSFCNFSKCSDTRILISVTIRCSVCVMPLSSCIDFALLGHRI